MQNNSKIRFVPSVKGEGFDISGLSNGTIKRVGLTFVTPNPKPVMGKISFMPERKLKENLFWGGKHIEFKMGKIEYMISAFGEETILAMAPSTGEIIELSVEVNKKCLDSYK